MVILYASNYRMIGGDKGNPCFTCDKRSGCKSKCYEKLEFDIFDRVTVALKCKKKSDAVGKVTDKYIGVLRSNYKVDINANVIMD